MATTGRVVSVDFMQKRSLILVRDETFVDIAAKFGVSYANCIGECSETGKEWTQIDDEVLRQPCLGILDCFNYKFIRISKKEPPPDTNVQSSSTSVSVNAFDVLMSVNKKRRLPDMKTNRFISE